MENTKKHGLNLELTEYCRHFYRYTYTERDFNAFKQSVADCAEKSNNSYYSALNTLLQTKTFEDFLTDYLYDDSTGSFTYTVEHNNGSNTTYTENYTDVVMDDARALTWEREYDCETDDTDSDIRVIELEAQE